MAIIDTSLRRESGCPVHFIWDGNGLGRPFVRLGFLLAVITGCLLTASVMIHAAGWNAGLKSVAGVFAVAAASVWLLGQALTRFSVLRAARFRAR